LTLSHGRGRDDELLLSSRKQWKNISVEGKFISFYRYITNYDRFSEGLDGIGLCPRQKCRGQRAGMGVG
jgi:hypothetical protein